MSADADTPVRRETFDGVLFDVDGTLISSIGAVDAHWRNVGTDLSVAPELMAETLVTMHGTRSIDILRVIRPDKANWEYVREMESRLPLEFASSATEIPGARALTEALTAAGTRWGVVTSGSVPLATGWLGLLGIPAPETLVTGEDVERGKPDPAPYLLGRGRLGVAEVRHRVLVCEDSPTGIRAGKAAGCFVLAVLGGGATPEEAAAAGADAAVRDFRQVRVVGGRAGEDGVAVMVEIEGDLLGVR